MHLALFLAFITFVGWGTADLFTIVVVRKIGANLTTFWVFFFSFLLSLMFLPFVPHDFSLITLPLLFLNIFLGILFVAGNVLVSEAFRISRAPIIGVIVPSVPAVTLIFSFIFYHDKITLAEIYSITLVLIGIGLCGINFNELKKTNKFFDKGAVLALLAIVMFSIFFTFSRILIEAYGWYLPTFIATACFPIILIFMRKQKEKFVILKEKKLLFAACMVGLLARSGDFAFNYGLSLPNASGIVAPIANAAPILFVISSYLIFKEKLSKQQITGIVITLVGIILLSH